MPNPQLPDLLPGYAMLIDNSGERHWIRPELIERLREVEGSGIVQITCAGLLIEIDNRQFDRLREAITVAWRLRERTDGGREVKHYLASEL